MTTQPRVNYDQIAHLYDEPWRDHPVDPHLLAFLDENLVRPHELAILDVGCGTGKQQTANKNRFPEALVVGLDRFRGMLQVARQRGRNVAWAQGNGMMLPFPNQQFHYATNQFSYPHIPDKARFVAEIYRVLRERGRFALTNIDPWQMADWPIYQFFPAARALDEQDFWPVERLIALFEATGFVNIQLHRDNRPIVQTIREFWEYASQRHRSSQFIAISDEAYQAGLARVRARLAQDEQEELIWQLCLITVTSDKL